MKFKEIEFKDKNAERIYSGYINRVKNAVKVLSKENQNDTLLEINSHIYESLLNSSKSEVERILDVTERLGAPEVFLKDLVAEKSLSEATKSFNPVKIAKALILNFTNGVSYILFFILYLTLFSFLFLIGAKIVDPENVGFFYKSPDIFVLGKIKDINVNYLPYEQLGNWFIPAMVLFAVIFYVLITLLLKLKRKINR